MAALPLRPQVFAILSALIEERSGLHYGLDDVDMIADKLSTRAIEAGFESLLDYYYFLRYDESSKAELDALVEALVVNETYFFRELDPLKRVVSDFIEPLAASGARPRVWCAACSTGEEPLTLAMLLSERALLGKVDLIASDISARALARARSGEVGLRALRGAPPLDLVARYLTEGGGRQRVRRDLIEAIQWLRVNLVEPQAVARLGMFDVILCRNILIYFSDATVKGVLDSLAAALRPGGALFVGTSESLLRFGTLLSCEERGGVFFYRKEHE
jgi:chemotaxis protein methyltransferase CheR